MEQGNWNSREEKSQTEHVENPFDKALKSGTIPILYLSKKRWGELVFYLKDNNDCLNLQPYEDCLKQLKDLRNVGKATLEDLHLLNIHTVDELAAQDPTTLFHQLEKCTQRRQDPCVWDVFAAIIHEASTGEATNWWSWTAKRKTLQKNGTLQHLIQWNLSK